MLAGEALYAALRRGYCLAADPVAHALASSPSSPVVFETFPQAIACVLAGSGDEIPLGLQFAT